MTISKVCNKVLQVRGGNRNNLGIISNILHKYIFCDPPLKLSGQDGSNKESQHMFSLRIKIIFELSSILPLIWSSVLIILAQSDLSFKFCNCLHVAAQMAFQTLTIISCCNKSHCVNQVTVVCN